MNQTQNIRDLGTSYKSTKVLNAAAQNNNKK